MNTPMNFALSCRRLCWAAGLLLVLAGVARAQDIDATSMIQGGLEVIRMIDTGNTGELWDGAAPGAKKRVTRADFIRQITQARAPLGNPQLRTWVTVERVAMNDQDPELAGQYVNVFYETRFAGRTSGSAREQITFHLDRDGTWRFSGYTIR